MVVTYWRQKPTASDALQLRLEHPVACSALDMLGPPSLACGAPVGLGLLKGCASSLPFAASASLMTDASMKMRE
ncbi:hypothetical protein [Streptomyces rubiginosohelvolus]|uniref:hypothetical protein n=1 Tax=Streptomyces rubiginosohelvolus TaxID=67362 RepID=UPI00371B676C